MNETETKRIDILDILDTHDIHDIIDMLKIHLCKEKSMN